MTTPPNGQQDALPSWNEGDAKQSIVDFVRRTTAEGSPEFVPLHERIALFDNDGTLWVEQPMYTQLAFVIADVKRLASAHPEWQTDEPFEIGAGRRHGRGGGIGHHRDHEAARCDPDRHVRPPSSPKR